MFLVSQSQSHLCWKLCVQLVFATRSFMCAGDSTQGLTHPRQTLNYSPSSDDFLYFFFFWDILAKSSQSTYYGTMSLHLASHLNLISPSVQLALSFLWQILPITSAHTLKTCFGNMLCYFMPVSLFASDSLHPPTSSIFQLPQEHKLHLLKNAFLLLFT